MKYNFIDLFAGAGGLSLGFCNAGFVGLFAVEKNKDAFETLKYNLIDKNLFDWPNWLTVQNHDIEDLFNKKEKLLKLIKNKVDVVIGGPPCQGFSMAGRRDHSDIRNQMVKRYIQFVRDVMPKYILLENVHGISVDFKIEGKKIQYSQIVINELQNLGYNIRTKEVKMSDFGVPQNRKRFILIGSLKNNIEDFFDKLYNNRNGFLKNKKLELVNTVEDAISDLYKENGVYKCPDCKQNFKSGKYGNAVSKYQKYMRKGLDVNQNPDSHRFANHTNTIVEMHQYMLDNIEKGKRITPSDGLVPNLKRRGVTILLPKGFAPTVTSHPDDFIHYKEPRILSVREMARLQSFPDWYQIKGKYTTGGQLRKVDVPRYTQIGNAVPPLFAEQVAEIFKELLNE